MCIMFECVLCVPLSLGIQPGINMPLYIRIANNSCFVIMIVIIMIICDPLCCVGHGAEPCFISHTCICIWLLFVGTAESNAMRLWHMAHGTTESHIISYVLLLIRVYTHYAYIIIIIIHVDQISYWMKYHSTGADRELTANSTTHCYSYHQTVIMIMFMSLCECGIINVVFVFCYLCGTVSQMPNEHYD